MTTEIDGEHASVVLADIARRPIIQTRVLVFANEKGGVGKSTLAFHTAVSLARDGEKVLAIDLDRRQRSLARALDNRAATARSLGIALPCPVSLVLEYHSGAMLAQEIARVGSDCSTIVIDVPGADSPIARRAIAMADKLITPVNANFVDLDGIARFSPASRRFLSMGKFAEVVTTLRRERLARSMADFEWVLVKNRVRPSEKLQLKRFDEAVAQLPARLGLKLAAGLTEQVAFRELYIFGLTHKDIVDLPGMNGARRSKTPDFEKLFEEIELAREAEISPPLVIPRVRPLVIPRVRPQAKSLQRYRQALRLHIGAVGDDPLSPGCGK